MSHNIVFRLGPVQQRQNLNLRRINRRNSNPFAGSRRVRNRRRNQNQQAVLARLLEDQEDLENDESVRGKKLINLRKSIKQFTQFWIVSVCFNFVFLIILKSLNKADYNSGECVFGLFQCIDSEQMCPCMHLFKSWLEYYAVLNLISAAHISCIFTQVNKKYANRKFVKMRKRFHTILWCTVIIIGLIFGFAISIASEIMFRDEICQDYISKEKVNATWNGFQRPSSALIIPHNEIFIVQRIAIAFLLVQGIFICRYYWQTAWYLIIGRYRRKQQLLETSDEEDDRVFRQEQERRHAEQIINFAEILQEQQIAEANQEIRANMGALNGIQQWIQFQQAQQQQLPNRDTELQDKLPAYIKQLKLIRYETSAHQANDQCSICLADFKDKDLVVVYECDPLHFFHNNCGLDWLKIKPQCPLCRTDFSNEILGCEVQDELIIDEADVIINSERSHHLPLTDIEVIEEQPDEENEPVDVNSIQFRVNNF